MDSKKRIYDRGKMSETTGISRNGISITVEHLPDRKKGCLIVSNGTVHVIVATFQSEYHEQFFVKHLLEMTGGNK